MPQLPLRDLHLPPEIGAWPLAPGWWLLIGLLVLLMTAALLLARFRQRRRLRRLALLQLETLKDLHGRELAAALSYLLRQAALCHFSPQQVAGLSGEAWLRFLDTPFADHPFSTGCGRCLQDAPYRPHVDIDEARLLELCRDWLKKLPPQSGPPRRSR
ncbi:hypothetical protein B5V00_05920 [Geothermobacter hydrogeniphilus]|uniref:DUF4381 domain-containing protein n=2 Tax=Geothermobacter hydrogeniphilus TaxID=1969733 RepID=A0A1X0Y8W2_9BACT|nr:hypothetical protein B5V00_05920 [Geothermobacter hydrogeniphilus]